MRSSISSNEILPGPTKEKPYIAMPVELVKDPVPLLCECTAIFFSHFVRAGYTPNGPREAASTSRILPIPPEFTPARRGLAGP